MAVILSTISNLKQITFMHSYTTLTHRLACCTAVMPHFQLQAETHVKAAEHCPVFYQQMSACKIMIRNDARTFVTLIYNDQVSCFPMAEMWAFWDDCQTVPSHTCVASAYIHPTPRVFFLIERCEFLNLICETVLCSIKLHTDRTTSTQA